MEQAFARFLIVLLPPDVLGDRKPKQIGAMGEKGGPPVAAGNFQGAPIGRTIAEHAGAKQIQPRSIGMGLPADFLSIYTKV